MNPEEIEQLRRLFCGIIQRFPELDVQLRSLEKYCMNETTFDETDFRRVFSAVVQAAPKMQRLKLNLPFKFISSCSRTATMLLATVFACIDERPEEHALLRTLVLDHVTDSTILDICQNPIDLRNALKSMQHLKNLVISIKRRETQAPRAERFPTLFWFMLSNARELESLCIVGWSVKCRDTRLHSCTDASSFELKSLPYDMQVGRRFANLRNLELKRVDLSPPDFMKMIEDHAESLKELYLNQVSLKLDAADTPFPNFLWIGDRPMTEKNKECTWLAWWLRDVKDLKLDVVRVTGLSYEVFDPNHSVHAQLELNYDLEDPSGKGKSFDQRFVEIATGIAPPICGPKTATKEPASRLTASRLRNLALSNIYHMCTAPDEPKDAWDAEEYQETKNSTSRWHRCIDGTFSNQNEEALRQLRKTIELADRGWNIREADAERFRNISVNGFRSTAASTVQRQADVPADQED